MRIDILTLFPEMFAPLSESIIGRATKNQKVQINVHDIREYTLDKHKKCDDYPFGGGAGMLMLPQPIASAIENIDPNHEALRIYTSPKGRRFEQKHIKKLLSRERLIILCGHYEGVDQRVLDEYIDDEISIGDYVLTGGELPAMVITDALCRYVDGVLAEGSLCDESFTGYLLEYPQYTRPQTFNGNSVPEVLLSGNHAKVDEWRKARAEELTQKKRPDLWRKYLRAQESERKKQQKLKQKQKLLKRELLKRELAAKNAAELGADGEKSSVKSVKTSETSAKTSKTGAKTSGNSSAKTGAKSTEKTSKNAGGGKEE